MRTPVKILIVEDEALLRMDIADEMQDAGFVVLEAGNADQAIALLDADPEIRLIFTDVDMPGSMDGLKLAAAVRDRWPPIKIIVTSGHRQVADFELPSESRFFGKPYRATAIAEAAREMLAV